MILRNLERQPVRTFDLGRSASRSPSPCCSSASSFIDVMDVLINAAVRRGDAAGRHGELRRAAIGARDLRRGAPAGRDGRRADARACRSACAPGRDRARSRSPGLPPNAASEPRRRSRRPGVCRCRRTAWCCRGCSARSSDVAPGRPVQVEVLEGARPVRDVPVAALVDDTHGAAGLHATSMRVRRLMREGGAITGAAVTLDPAATGRVLRGRSRRCRPSPAWRCATSCSQNFRDTMAENMNLQIFFNVIFAGIIAFGVVYNSARVSLSEREPRAGEPARARLHARGDLAHPARRAGDAHGGGAAGRRRASATASAG